MHSKNIAKYEGAISEYGYSEKRGGQLNRRNM